MELVIFLKVLECSRVGRHMQEKLKIHKGIIIWNNLNFFIPHENRLNNLGFPLPIIYWFWVAKNIEV